MIKTFSSFKSVAFPDEKRKIDPTLSLPYRVISLPISWMLYNKNVSPNAITILQILFGLLGCALLFYYQTMEGLAFCVVILHFAYVLDCVDGEIARAAQKSSLQGVFLDKFAHAITMQAMFVTFGAYYASHIPQSSFWILSLSWLASFATFNPSNRLVLTVVDALIRKNEFSQYDINNYMPRMSSDPADQNKAAYGQFSQVIGHANRAKGLLKIALNLFRHVAYLAGITVLLILEIFGVSIGIIGILWMFVCLIVIVKEVTMFIFVTRTEMISNRFNETMTEILQAKTSDSSTK